MVTVTGCEVSYDRSVCNVFYTTEPDRYDEVAAAFQRARRGAIRSLMAKDLEWRVAPELRFLLDTSVDHAERIAQRPGQRTPLSSRGRRADRKRRARRRRRVRRRRARRAVRGGRRAGLGPRRRRRAAGCGPSRAKEQGVPPHGHDAADQHDPRADSPGARRCATTSSICGHVSPDGDCIGSQLALMDALRSPRASRPCTACWPRTSPSMRTWRFLPGADELVPAERSTGGARGHVRGGGRPHRASASSSGGRRSCSTRCALRGDHRPPRLAPSP